MIYTSRRLFMLWLTGLQRPFSRMGLHRAGSLQGQASTWSWAYEQVSPAPDSQRIYIPRYNWHLVADSRWFFSYLWDGGLTVAKGSSARKGSRQGHSWSILRTFTSTPNLGLKHNPLGHRLFYIRLLLNAFSNRLLAAISRDCHVSSDYWW